MDRKSTLRIVPGAVGTEKFTVLAVAVDTVKADQDMLRNMARIVDEIETIDMKPLAERYGVGEKTLREQLEREIGEGSHSKTELARGCAAERRMP